MPGALEITTYGFSCPGASQHPLTMRRAPDTIETNVEIETATGTETEVIEDAQDLRTIDHRGAITKETPIPLVETTEPEREKTDTAQEEKSENGIETEAHGAVMMIGSLEEIAIYSTTEEEVLVVAAETVVIAVDGKTVMSSRPKPVGARTALPRRNVNPRQISPTLYRYWSAKED